MAMANEVKKEHFVPQCYLEAWTRPGSLQVQVYDKKRNKYRSNSVEDISCQRRFYDTAPINLLPEEELRKLLRGENVSNNDADCKIIEHAFANLVEGEYKTRLDGLIKTAHDATPWIINNCYFINVEEKATLSELLAIQYMRTNSVRKRMGDTSECFVKLFGDMGFPQTAIDQYRLTKQDIKDAHLQLLIDSNSMESIAESFYYLTWNMCLNKTSTKFYTSDNPIVPIPHYNSPFRSGIGLRSMGVEVFFPVSPDCALIMCDGRYHKIENFDRRIITCDDPTIISSYNSKTAVHAEVDIYSQNGDWETVRQLMKNTPDVFMMPRTTIVWGGNTYAPNKFDQ